MCDDSITWFSGKHWVSLHFESFVMEHIWGPMHLVLLLKVEKIVEKVNLS